MNIAAFGGELSFAHNVANLVALLAEPIAERSNVLLHAIWIVQAVVKNETNFKLFCW
jgi:hypothetical protein